MKYDIINNEKEHIDGLNRYQLVSKENPKISVNFETIDCTNKSQELIDKLAIIRGDVYDVCQGVVDKCIIITNWNDYLFEESITLFQTYLNDNNIATGDVPVFFIIAVDYDNDAKFMGKLIELGFSTADHLVDLDNNYVMVMTSVKRHKELMKNYVARHMM